MTALIVIIFGYRIGSYMNDRHMLDAKLLYVKHIKKSRHKAYFCGKQPCYETYFTNFSDDFLVTNLITSV